MYSCVSRNVGLAADCHDPQAVEALAEDLERWLRQRFFAKRTLIFRGHAYDFGRKMCVKLKELIPRQQFDIAIQAAIWNLPIWPAAPMFRTKARQLL